MSDTTSTDTTTPAKAAKPPVFDNRGETPARGQAVPVALNQRVKVLGDKYQDDEGKPKLGTITGIEYQRKRVVIKLDSQEKLIVRPAEQVFVMKDKSGKVEFDAERMAKAVRGAKAKQDDAPAPAAEVTTDEVEAEVVADETAGESTDAVLTDAETEGAPSPV